MLPKPFSPYELYIQGMPEKNISIKKHRIAHLLELQKRMEEFKVSVHCPFENKWTKWDYVDLPEKVNIDTIERAYDVHRTICDFEIVVESDYPLYQENVKAVQELGKLIEDDYNCHYYYSGGKSIHVHIYIDYESLRPGILKYEQELSTYIKSFDEFKRKFIEFERKKIINLQTTWSFDEQLIKGSHLIRSELSLHSKNFKTFLGFTYKDITSIPYCCNVKTKLYPAIATFAEIEEENDVLYRAKMTHYTNPERKIEEFLGYLMSESVNVNRNAYKDFKFTEMRPIVKELYENPQWFQGDGRKRIFFILKCEIKNVYDEKEARLMLLNWNDMVKNPYTEEEILYHVQSTKNYNLSNKYIKEVIDEVIGEND